MEIDKSFWKDKKILITGHTGFKGCWLSIWLHKLGANVIGYSLKEYPNDQLFKECKMDEKMIDKRGDICDLERLKSVFKEYTPEIVFHLAAQPLVRLSYDKPLKTLNTNIMGTVNVLECIKDFGCVKAATIITSDKCYQNNEWVWGYRENDPVGGKDPYSCSKGCVELIVNAYRQSFFKNLNKFVATARAGNVIGGGDWSKDRIIPDCVKAIIKKKPIEVRNPNATRPWQHVLEPLSGYLLLGKKLLEGKDVDSAWNFGPKSDSILPVKKVVEMFIGKWGSGKWVDISNRYKNLHESKLLSLDISKALFLLNWMPKLNIEETVEFTVHWYKKHNKDNSFELCLKQIEKYEKK